MEEEDVNLKVCNTAVKEASPGGKYSQERET